ncbi:hypothetical protein ES703_83235 [subsurface metagenome]
MSQSMALPFQYPHQQCADDQLRTTLKCTGFHDVFDLDGCEKHIRHLRCLSDRAVESMYFLLQETLNAMAL